MGRRDDESLEIVELIAEDVEPALEEDGGDGDPPGRGIDRRWFVVGGAVLAVWIAIALVSRDRGSNRPADRAAATTSTSVASTSTTSTTLPRFDAGPLFPGATGRLAIVTGGRLMLVDAATGEVQPVRLPAGTASIVASNGNSLLATVRGDNYLVDVNTDDVPVRVFDEVFAAITPGRWWAADEGRLVDALTRAPDGPVLPASFEPIASLRDGFLLHDTSRQMYATWRPGDGSVPFLNGTNVEIVATHPDRIAWRRTCTTDQVNVPRCTIFVTDVASGRTAFVEGPVLGNRTIGRFSPNGTVLAVYREDGTTRTASIILADVASGETLSEIFVEPAPSPSDFRPDFAQPVPFDWEPDGSTLLVALGTPVQRRAVVVSAATGDLGAGVAIPTLDQVIRIGGGVPPEVVPLAPARARATTGIEIVAITDSRTVEIFDVDTSAVRQVDLGEVRPGDASFLDGRVIPTAGGLVVANGTEVFWIADGVSRSLGPGDSLLAGAEADEAWITSSLGALHALTRVDGRTGELGTPIVVRALPRAVVHDGFVQVVAASFDRPGAIEVWNPATRRTKRVELDGGQYPELVTSWGDVVVWSAGEACGGPSCPLFSVNIRTGVTRALALTNSFAYNARGGILYGFGSERELVAHDLATGTETPVPGGGLFRDPIIVSSRGWVMFDTDEGKGAWRPGLELAAPLPIAIPPLSEYVAR